MPAKVSDPFQEQLVQARRAQILDAATQVFAAKGFHRATIHDVAQAAGIADGTIYNYFDNKTALLLGILNRLNETERRQDDFQQGAQSDFRQFFRSYLRQRYQTIIRSGFEVFQIVLSEVLVNADLRQLYYQQVIEPTFALTEKFLYAWIEQGVIRPINVSTWMRAISGMTIGMIFLRIMGDPELEAKWDDIPDMLADFILDGILPSSEERS